MQIKYLSSNNNIYNILFGGVLELLSECSIDRLSCVANVVIEVIEASSSQWTMDHFGGVIRHQDIITCSHKRSESQTVYEDCYLEWNYQSFQQQEISRCCNVQNHTTWTGSPFSC